MLTRTQFLVEVRQALDAVTSQRWLDGTLVRWGGLQMRRDWAAILNANRFFRWAERQPALTAGVVPLAALSTGSGVTAQHFYRVLAVRGQDGESFRKIDGDMVGFGAGNTIEPQSRTWWREGTQLRVTPRSYPGTLRVYVNFYPGLVNELADGDTIDYPEGFEMGLVLATAGLAFSKGNAEIDATGNFLALADEIRKDMLADVVRDSTDPIGIEASDSPLDWDG